MFDLPGHLEWVDLKCQMDPESHRRDPSIISWTVASDPEPCHLKAQVNKTRLVSVRREMKCRGRVFLLLNTILPDVSEKMCTIDTTRQRDGLRDHDQCCSLYLLAAWLLRCWCLQLDCLLSGSKKSLSCIKNMIHTLNDGTSSLCEKKHGEWHKRNSTSRPTQISSTTFKWSLCQMIWPDWIRSGKWLTALLNRTKALHLPYWFSQR